MHPACDPRTQIRGLIEASRRRSSNASSPARDPRTQIRGLIEAGRVGAGAFDRGEPIRGLRSAASLKHLSDARGGPAREGSIRGLRSAASLKRQRPP